MNITLRPVTMEDAAMLLEWKNDEDTRKNAILTDAVIKMEDHLVWLESRLKRGFFWVVFLGKTPVGDFRIEDGEVSIRIAKQFRGCGIANDVIGFLGNKITIPGNYYTAKIRVHNIPSLRAFIGNGFKLVEYIESPVPYYILRK